MSCRKSDALDQFSRRSSNVTMARRIVCKVMGCAFNEGCVCLARQFRMDYSNGVTNCMTYAPR